MNFEIPIIIGHFSQTIFKIYKNPLSIIILEHFLKKNYWLQDNNFKLTILNPSL